MDSNLWPADDPRLATSNRLDDAERVLRSAVLEDPGAREHLEVVLDFIRREPGAAHRTTLEGHLTGSALVVDSAGEQTLLMLHRKLGRWFQPGGHCDGDTNLVAVALKEASEETGIAGLRILPEPIDVDIHRVDPPGEPNHLHLDTRFLVVAPPGASETANEESLDLRWVTELELDELRPVIDPGTRRLVEVGLARARRLLR